jgi:uncharacterized protein (DUF1778 family)
MKSKNLTISLDEDLLKAGKRYAKLKGTSITQLFRSFLEKSVVSSSNDETASELLDALDQAAVNQAGLNRAEGRSKGRRWSREDAYSK